MKHENSPRGAIVINVHIQIEGFKTERTEEIYIPIPIPVIWVQPPDVIPCFFVHPARRPGRRRPFWATHQMFLRNMGEQKKKATDKPRNWMLNLTLL
ncbi:hypothetical protein DDZ15_04200 [Rhodohalobacter mucosus]|uniref:Uncharacterized protein n=1 Tax=Rhodohalobacter mucosus TaxID=2079485 RepID=A0A316TUT0_9BACT|nr:hypothetical protein DDZ15_04200 [Rhodohalobacter mucosus]